MSMIRCEECEHVIKSDDDPECFLKIRPGRYVVLCQWCRDDMEVPHSSELLHEEAKRG